MLQFLFECTACQTGVTTPSTLPLCRDCAGSLVTAPALCPSCAGLGCASARCVRPWITHEGIDSFSARYLCIEPGYRVLKRWKTAQAPAMDRKILLPDFRLLSDWRSRKPDLITWIPQERERSWSLGACPARKIASWVSYQLTVPVLETLAPAPKRAGQLRQAELNMHERLTHRMSFQAAELEDFRLKGASVLLVDDFMTTGRTLKTAAQSLRSRGALAVHAFCLGVRPLRESCDR
jgi:predicted amidophosphoribosyltransferase